MSKYLILSWEKYQDYVFRLVDKISYRFDKIVCIARGGLVIGRLLSDLLDISDVESIGIQFYKRIGETNDRPRLKYGLKQDISGLKILLADDIADSGETLRFAEKYLWSKNPAEIRTAVIFVKPWTKIAPNYYVDVTDKWVVFPYEFREVIQQILEKDFNGENIIDAERFLINLGFNKNLVKYILSKIWCK